MKISGGFFAQKTAPDTVASEWGGKNNILFLAEARFLQRQVLCRRRNKVSASRPYAPDTREMCFQGPSRVLWYFNEPHSALSRTGQSREMKSIVARLRRTVRFVRKSRSVSPWTLHSFALLRYAVIASTEQLPFGLGAAAENVRVESEGKITCTARPDESDARNGRLQPAGCARTGSLHARGMHESDGCNGSRLPAEPDTSRCPQPWRSG